MSCTAPSSCIRCAPRRWEIAMPMGCRAAHHMNIGCTNGTGDYIHPGDPTNVYEKFTLETNPLTGGYHNCNPDPPFNPDGTKV